MVECGLLVIKNICRVHFTIVLSVSALTTCTAQIGIMTYWIFKLVVLGIWTWTHCTMYVSHSQQPHKHGTPVSSLRKHFVRLS